MLQEDLWFFLSCWCMSLFLIVFVFLAGSPFIVPPLPAASPYLALSPYLAVSLFLAV